MGWRNLATRHIRTGHDTDAGGTHRFDGAGNIRRTNATACVLDQVGLEAESRGVESRGFDAVIRRQPAHKDVGDAIGLEELAQTGRLAASVIKEPAVTIDLRVCALEEYVGAPGVQSCDEFRPCFSLDAVNRPESLRQAVQLDLLESLLSRVMNREAAMVGGMPVLGKDDCGEGFPEAVHDRDNRGAIGNREGTGDEIVLHVNDDQGMGDRVRFHNSKLNPFFRSRL